MTRINTTLAGNCFFIKGHSKNLLIDLQNGDWYHVDFNIENEKDIDTSEIDESSLNHLFDSQIFIKLSEVMSFMFPKIKTEFDIPSFIEFAIVDRDDTSNYSISVVINWIDSLFTKFYQFRYYCEPCISDLELILKMTQNLNVESIDFLLPYSKEIEAFFDEHSCIIQKLIQ